MALVTQDINIAKESTSQEILGKLSDGVAGVTAQTKKFTNITNGSLSNKDTAVTITGCGMITFYRESSTKTEIYASVDGGAEVTIIDYFSEGTYAVVYFEESIVMRGNNAKYIIQT